MRHANDYACILLIDERYSRPQTITALPSFIQVHFVFILIKLLNFFIYLSRSIRVYCVTTNYCKFITSSSFEKITFASLKDLSRQKKICMQIINKLTLTFNFTEVLNVKLYIWSNSRKHSQVFWKT